MRAQQDSAIAKAAAESKVLAFLERADLALASANEVPELLHLLKSDEAIVSLAKKFKLESGILCKAGIARLRTVRKIGQRLVDLGFGKKGGDRKSKPRVGLDSLGIERHLSQRSIKVSELPEDQWDKMERGCEEQGVEPTLGFALRAAKQYQNSIKRTVIEEMNEPAASHITDLAACETKFKVIYADPPWQYGNQGTRAATNNHYPTMPLDEIAALPVRDVADDESILFLWVTNGFLFESKRVIDAWGFTFKSSMVWVKPQMGIGNYVRNAHEMLLICNRGGFIPNGKSQISWLSIPRTKHSKKPHEFRKVIEKMAPGPRLEMFARDQFDGWTTWGNQAEWSLNGSV
jgi:N6-adenosine-specific RNA methylase IME4